MTGVSSIKGAMPLHHSPMVAEERMSPGHWLGLMLMLYIPFDALTVMVEWQEGYPVCKKPHSTNPQRFVSRTVGGGPRGNWLTHLSGTMAVKWK